MSLPKAIFENTMNIELAKAVKPPAKKHLGKRLRVVEPFITAKEVWVEQFTIARGFPAEEEAAYISRNGDDVLKPFKSTKLQDTYKVKLQDPDQIDAFYRFHALGGDGARRPCAALRWLAAHRAPR